MKRILPLQLLFLFCKTLCLAQEPPIIYPSSALKLEGVWETPYEAEGVSYRMEYVFSANKTYSATLWPKKPQMLPSVWTGTWSLSDQDYFTQTFDTDNTIATAHILWSNQNTFTLTVVNHPDKQSVGKKFHYERVVTGPKLIIPIGHTESIGSVAFSPDGKYIFTGSDDGAAKIWDRQGQEIRSFNSPYGEVLCVAFSPDGKYLLTGYEGMTLLWDLQGHIIQAFENPFAVLSLAFSPNGKFILTGSYDINTNSLEETSNLWDLQGHNIKTFIGHIVRFSPDGRYIMTGSVDRKTRLWDLNGFLIQVLSDPTIGIASSIFLPDGKSIQTQSADGSIKFWDMQGREIQGKKIQVFKNAPSSSVFPKAFSPDGKYLVKDDFFNNQVKLCDLSGHEIQSFKGHTSWINTVTFSPDGRQVLTGSRDNTAKLWDLDGRLVQTFAGHSSSVNSVAFSPDNKAIVTGSFESPAKLWDIQGRSLQALTGPVDTFNTVSFSPDGKYILTRGWNRVAKLWDLNGREIRTFADTTQEILSAAFSPDGKSVLTRSKNGTIHLWDFNGRKIQTIAGQRSEVHGVSFSSDGKYILTGSGLTAVLYDLKGNSVQKFEEHTSEDFFPSMSVAISPDGKYVLTASDRNPVKMWNINGRKIRELIGHADSSTVFPITFSPNGKYILTGSNDRTAKIWNLNGKVIQTFTGHLSDVFGAVFSPVSPNDPAGGAFVLTGSPDNTAKIWDSATGRELATLISVDSTDWVVTTPSGLFDASPGAMQLMHYVLGTEVIDLDQLKERYYEPGLLAKITGLSKGVLRDVAAFDQIALYPEISARIEKERLSVELNRRNGGIGKLSLFINGKEVQEDINPERQNKLDIDLRVYAKYYITNNTNLIALKAYNEEGWLRSQDYELKYRPVSTSLPGSSAKYQPHLFALMVGTSDYAGNGLDLRFADLDAEAMAKVITEVGGALFGEAFTTVRLLSTAGNTPWEMSTFPNINQAFQDIAAKAQPEDVLMIYFSGHGLAYGPAEKEQFYYLTKDISSADLSDPEIRKNYTVSSEDLTRWLTAISAQKQVMILDACNAGKVVESLTTLVQKTLDPSQIRALERMKDRTGMFILTGSAADKISYESNQYGQGLLTYSLLQGISGLALTSDKRVDVMTLFQYARDQVPILAKGIGGIQTPVVAFPYSGASFDIGLVTARTTLPSMQGKPVFIRSNFQDENFGDELGVANALAAYFQGISLKGSQADIIYVDVNEYQNGYSIRGRYTYNGNVVQVTGSLLKGDVSQGKFELSGKKNDLPGLVQLILDKVRPLIK